MLAQRLLESASFLGPSPRDYRFQRLLLLRDIITPAVSSMEMLLKERGGDVSQIHVTDLSSIPPLWLDQLTFQQAFSISCPML